MKQKEKRIKIEFNNGEIYYLDATIVAKERVDYYTEVYGYKKDSPEWTEEYEYLLNNDNELLDWIENNMDWSDIKNQVYKLGDQIPYNYDDEFCNAELDIIE
jgi:hypothetical protein